MSDYSDKPSHREDTLSLLMKMNAMGDHLTPAQKKFWEEIHAKRGPHTPLHGTLEYGKRNPRRYQYPNPRVY